MRALLAVFAGGLVGTGLRLAVDTAVPAGDDGFPVGTLLVNLAGTFALALLVGGVWRRVPRASWWKAAIGPGLLGSFTTFSAVAASAVLLTERGAGVLAGAYVVASVVGGLGPAAVGLATGSRLAHRRMPRSVTDRGETL